LSAAGYFTLASGAPLTPYISASVGEVERGTHGSLRPNRVPAASIGTGGGHVDHWFNTAAFSTSFAPGQLYGTASRYAIPGPGMENINLSVSKIVQIHENKPWSSAPPQITRSTLFSIPTLIRRLDPTPSTTSAVCSRCAS
jgi:hypothetical protein